MRAFVVAALTCVLALAEVADAQGVKNFSLEAVVDESNASSDSKFELKDQKGKIVVLHFLLKTECPFCLRYTNQYANLAATTPGVVHLFIKPDSKTEILGWVKKLEKTDSAKHPTIYRDPGAKLAKQFGIPNGYQFHGQTMHYPALVVLNGNGEEMFRYVGKSNSDRMSKDEFVKKLESMSGK